MKKILPLFLTAILCGSMQFAFAQENHNKNVNVEKNEDGITVTITEEKDGKKTTKVLTGEDAEKYLEDSEHNIFIQSGDNENVFIMEMDGEHGEGHSYWVEEMEMDMDKMTEEIEALQEELEKLSTEEISERLEEIKALKEEMHKMKIVEMTTMGENVVVHGVDGDIDVNVEVDEEDGVIVITKTIGDSKEVEEIKVNTDAHAKYVFVTKNEGTSNEKSIEISKDADGDMFEANVYPNPNNGNFTIDLELLSDEPAYVKVTDSSGKEVYSEKVQGKQKHSLNVKLKKPAAGMYVVSIEQQGKKMKMKTVIE